MRLRITNISTPAFDVLGFGFKSAGALEIFNEYSGYAVTSARYSAFTVLKQRTPNVVTLSGGRRRIRNIMHINVYNILITIIFTDY